MVYVVPWTLIEWKEDLILGVSVIWISLGTAHMITAIICIVYLFKKVNWKQAAKNSQVEMERIQNVVESKSRSQSQSQYKEPLINDVDNTADV